ncbi:MAG: hypothetical protein Q4G25_10030 [Paracoccus sp. (in: a-proteobacteria)]|nr:hypothetical protein [Paracoccus sp. (in: a-proteobacteria)]
MTTGNAITIFMLIVALLVVDALWLHWDIAIVVGQGLVDFVEYLSFWR